MFILDTTPNKSIVENSQEQFSFETFKQIAASSQRNLTKQQQIDMAWLGRTHPEIDYAKKHLKKLGQGSARIVFELDDSSVLKIAKNDSGLAQNETEIKIYLSVTGVNKNVITEIKDYDKNEYKWIVAEKVKALTEKEFEEISGIPEEIFNLVLEQFHTDPDYAEKALLTTAMHNDYGDRISKSIFTWLKNKRSLDFIKNLANLAKIFDLGLGDLVAVHIGLSKDGKIKLFDYGYTEAYS